MTYQPALDGVRGVAVAMVLLFHAGFGWMSGGFVGVSVFFTLSGYLITSLALDEWQRTGRLDVGAFYGRRVRRLTPASLVCIAAVIVAAIAGQFNGVTGLRTDVWGALAQVYNWVVLAGGDGYARQMAEATGQRSPLDHYWSLAIEEQFYWVWPLVLLLVLRGSARVRLFAVGALLAITTTAAFVIAAVWGSEAAYLVTPARLPEILCGCVLAVVLHGRSMAESTRGSLVIGLGLLGAAVVVWASITWTVGGGPVGHGWLAALGLASTALVLGLQVASPLRSALSWRPLAALGRISYGVYLYHWPVFTLVDERRFDIGTWPLFALRMLITLPLAIVSYRLLERPVRSWRIPWRPAVGYAAVATALVAVVTVAVPNANGGFNYVSAATRDAAAFIDGPVGADGDGPVNVMVVGDSTAYAMGEGMVAWAAEHPDVLRVEQAAAIGCGLNPTGVLPDDDFKVPCVRNWGDLPERVAARQPDVVFAMVTLRDLEDREFDGEGLLTPADPRFQVHLEAGYQWMTSLLLDSGAERVVWLIPPVPDLPPRGSFAKMLEPDRRQAYHDVVWSLADPERGVEVADFDAWMDQQDDPPARDDGLHFSLAGAMDATERYLAPLAYAVSRPDAENADEVPVDTEP